MRKSSHDRNYNSIKAIAAAKVKEVEIENTKEITTSTNSASSSTNKDTITSSTVSKRENFLK